MQVEVPQRGGLRGSLKKTVAAIAIGTFAAAMPAAAQHSKDDHGRFPFFFPGNLVVSRSVYDNNPNNVQVGEILPPNCGRHRADAALPVALPTTAPRAYRLHRVATEIL